MFRTRDPGEMPCLALGLERAHVGTLQKVSAGCTRIQARRASTLSLPTSGAMRAESNAQLGTVWMAIGSQLHMMVRKKNGGARGH